MAIKAGRVGVNRSDVDELGHVTAGGLTPEERAKLDNALVAPKPTLADVGKVLTVGDDGELEWHTAGGGGGYTKLDDSKISLDNTIYFGSSGEVKAGNLGAYVIDANGYSDAILRFKGGASTVYQIGYGNSYEVGEILSITASVTSGDVRFGLVDGYNSDYILISNINYRMSDFPITDIEVYVK